MGGGSFLQKNCYSKIFCRFQNFGENTGEKRVSFFKILGQTRAKNVYLLLVVGWLVGWLDVFFFFAHSDLRVECIPELREDKPSLRSEKNVEFEK